MAKTATEWRGSPSILGLTVSIRMIFLTFSLIGIQFCWGLEATYVTPYLLSLGMSKSSTTLVFVAGPISGLIMQPIVGALADRSTSRFGRRRPFMVGGAIVVACCFLTLGWTKEVVGFFVLDQTCQREITLAVAIVTIYLVDFAINAIQSGARSLIVDTLPIADQQAGSAWASRVGTAGHLMSYGIGTLDLVSILPAGFGGDTQFKKMTAISVVMLLISTSVTCLAVTERVLISSPDHKSSIWGVLPSLWKRTFNLPPRVQAICWVQFWAWIGWFSFLFYSSTWVGETYYRYEHKPSPDESDNDVLGNIGRLGSLSLVLFSIVTFAGTVIFPLLVRSSIPGSDQEKYTARPPQGLPGRLRRILVAIWDFPRPDVVTAWLWSHIAFALITVWAPLVKSLAGATLLVALLGLPMAMGGWAPFSEMGIEINQLAISETADVRAVTRDGYGAVLSHDIEDEEERTQSTPTDAQRRRSSNGVCDVKPGSEHDDGSTGELAGVYLGVLNVYTTLPQFVGTFISWLVFTIVNPDRAEGGDGASGGHKWVQTSGISAIGIVFFISSLSALGAANATRKLKKLS